MKTAFLACAFATFLPSICAAQTVVAPTSSTRNDAPPTLERGRVLLSVLDARALPILRAVALRELSDFSLKKTTAQKEAALRACLWWGKAAQTFGERDEAIEALSRGLETIRALPASGNVSDDEQELRSSMSAILLNGLPQRATNQTLQLIASEINQNVWQPVRFSFNLPNIEYSKSLSLSENDNFLLTQGIVTLPIARTPSLYKALDATTLPPELKMTRAIVGYAREIGDGGVHRGDALHNEIWRQKVRVLYAPIDSNEQSRAQKIAAQWLRISTLFDNFLGRRNAYSNDSVTTIWLTRQSAEWPQNAPRENWNAGAWIDSAPDQMMLFRSGETRSEAEWLREVAHEYSHISVPPFAGFQAPLEPFGNGRLGETLLLLWAAQSPATFFAPDEREQMRNECEAHVARHAIPALETWRALDPTTPLSASGDLNNLNRLIGLAIEIERVYGAGTLRCALDFAAQGKDEKWRRNGIEYSMSRNAAKKPAVLRASDLLRGMQNAIGKVSDFAPIWLAGALQLRNENGKTVALAPRDLIRHTLLSLKENQSASGWFYFPANAKLEIAVDGTALKIDGAWKTEKTASTLTLFNVGKSGWRKLSFRAMRAIVLQSAQLKSATK